MNEAKSVRSEQAAEQDDHLPTTRLPPLPAPPPSGAPPTRARPGSMPPAPVPASAMQPVDGARGGRTSLGAAVASAVRSTLKLGAQGLRNEVSLQVAVGVASVLLGLILVTAGLVLALRGAPASGAQAAVVVAALVVARALGGVAMVGVGVALARLGERLLSPRRR